MPSCRSALAAALASLALLALAPRGHADLEDYVKKPDKSFAWKLESKTTLPLLGHTVYQIDLTSQTWQKIVWKHKLLVVVPAKVKPAATMFLWNQGGAPNDNAKLLAAGLATKMQAPVAFLFGVPNQPLFDGKREDALIAETFVRYLETKDADWPLLFPMVKSLVRAMDALQAFALQEWEFRVTSFVVCGASKRGWTTWLTGAADSRVKAIIPMVIDTLNMAKQLPHQLESYGAYSEMIKDYTARELVPLPDTADAKKLWLMVDPWTYRDKVKVPKMIVNGTNDPYWTQDALNLYWDDLKGPKSLAYVPNAGHNLAQTGADGKQDFTRVANVLSAFGRSQIHDTAMAKLTWKHEDGGDGKYRLVVTSDTEPKAVRLWQAEAETKDFRKSRWKDTALGNEKKVTATVEGPAKGYRVFLVEMEFEMGKMRYDLTTQLRIVGAKK